MVTMVDNTVSYNQNSANRVELVFPPKKKRRRRKEKEGKYMSDGCVNYKLDGEDPFTILTYIKSSHCTL